VKLVLYPAIVVILLVTGNIGGMETTGKIRQIEVIEVTKKRASFTEIKLFNVYQSTHAYILFAAVIFPK
jgi:hypothetical protein